MAEPVNIAERVGMYVTLRDWIEEQDEKHKARLRAAKEEMAKIEGELSEFMRATGQKNGATANGSFYVTHKNTAAIEDKSQFHRFVIGGEQWDLIDMRANANAVAEFMEKNNGETPPGVKYKKLEVIHVNRPR